MGVRVAQNGVVEAFQHKPRLVILVRRRRERRGHVIPASFRWKARFNCVPVVSEDQDQSWVI
jgi:hypothetical protein